MNRKLLALTLFLIATDAQAAYLTGNELLNDCKAERVGCYAYLMAAVDAHDTWVEWGDLKKQFCVPATTVTGEQLRLIALKYMESRPEQLHLTAGSLVANAMGLAFPCN